MKLRMKKFLAAGIAALMLFAFAACGVKLDISVDIAEDGTVTFGTVTAYDEEFIDTMIQYGDGLDLETADGEAGSDQDDGSGTPVDIDDPGDDVQKEYTDEDRWAYIEKQVFEGISDKDYERYETTDAKGIHWMGFTIKRPAKNIDDLTAQSAPQERFNIYRTTDDSDWGGDLFYKNGKNYVSNMMVDISEDEDFSSIKENNEGMDISMLVVVTLPTKAISSNASEVSKDGKTLTWNLMDMEDPNIDFEFDLHPFPTTIVLLAVLGVVVLLLIAAVVFLIVNMTKKSKKYDDNLAALAGDTAEGDPVRPEIQDPAEGTGDPASVDEVSDSDVSPVTDDTMSESAIETAEELKAEALEAAKEAEEEAREAAEESVIDIEETEDPVEAEETEDPSGEGDTE